jgi:hypothetical protein
MYLALRRKVLVDKERFHEQDKVQGVHEMDGHAPQAETSFATDIGICCAVDDKDES